MLALLRSRQPAKKYLITTFLVSCLLLGAFTFVIYQQSQINQKSNAWVVDTFRVLFRSSNLLNHMYDSNFAQRAYTNTGVERYLIDYHRATQLIDGDIDYLATQTLDNTEQTTRVAELRELLVKFKQQSTADLAGKRSKAAATSKARDRIIDEVRSKVRAFSGTELELLNKRIADAESQQRNYMLTLFIGAILNLGALIIANLLIFGLVNRSSGVEKELKRSEERFRLLMHGINDGVFDHDLEAGTVHFSPSCKSMLGYTEEEFPDTAHAFGSLLHPDDSPKVEKALQDYADHRIPFYTSLFRMQHKDGAWRWILARGVGIWNHHGNLQRLVGVHTDMTEQKRREEELQQLNADLEGFTYIASHDLRAPLVNLKGFSGEMEHSLTQARELLTRMKRHLAPSEQSILSQVFDRDLPEAIGFIQTSVEKMDKLTGSILDLSRIGRREYHLSRIDSNALVRHCLDTLAYEINSNGVEVYCGDLPYVMSDSLALEQVFGNIIDNAVKYLDPARPGRIEINAIELSTEIIFSISDNGRGINANDERKVFDIFRRAGNAGDVRGAGMGMAYVKATLRKLGGRIWFQSSPGVGTTFYVSLPVHHAIRSAA